MSLTSLETSWLQPRQRLAIFGIARYDYKWGNFPQKGAPGDTFIKDYDLSGMSNPDGTVYSSLLVVRLADLPPWATCSRPPRYFQHHPHQFPSPGGIPERSSGHPGGYTRFHWHLQHAKPGNLAVECDNREHDEAKRGSFLDRAIVGVQLAPIR